MQVRLGRHAFAVSGDEGTEPLTFGGVEVDVDRVTRSSAGRRSLCFGPSYAEEARQGGGDRRRVGLGQPPDAALDEAVVEGEQLHTYDGRCRQPGAPEV